MSLAPEQLNLDFDGRTYDREKDQLRLSLQVSIVYEVMKDGLWRVPAQISAATGLDWATASARCRDFRKPRFGSHTLLTERVKTAKGERGLFRYRLIVRKDST